MTAELTRLQKELYEKLIRDLLTQLLKREPEIEDAKRITLGTSIGFTLPRGGWYMLVSFDGVHIGKIKSEWQAFNNFVVTFEPDKMFSTDN